jgi:trans-aconitate methyltransferase
MHQDWNAADYAAHGGFVASLGRDVVDLLQTRPGERILDLGCGDGRLTVLLAERGAEVVGIDTSAGLLSEAAARGVDARLLDACNLSFDAEFDAVFSNAVLHWVPDIDSALRGVHNALKRGGRFVGEFGGHGNVAAICTALRAVAGRRGVTLALPWYFPAAEEFAERLGATGFEVESSRLFARPTLLPSGITDWLRTFANGVLESLSPADRDGTLTEVASLLRPALCDSQGRWTADYVRIRFVARKPRT